MLFPHLLKLLFYALLLRTPTGTCAFSIRSTQYNNIDSSSTAKTILGFQQRRNFYLLHSQDKDDGGGGSSNDDNNYDKEKNEVNWRDFRAKLVMSEKKGDELQMPSLDATSTENGDGGATPEQWAYESGPMIETGSVILCKPRTDLGYGLRQQYFHKAVILVLDHDVNFFTKGIILNRPSNCMLQDGEILSNDGGEWRVWFGGEVQGMTSDDEDIICLHSLSSDAANRVSQLVMRDIKYTTLEDAKKLVQTGDAQPNDFWVFSGYAGWSKGQLLQEVTQDSWTMVTTDSNTLLKELAKQALQVDPEDAGLDTWKNLMNMVASGSAESSPAVIFDDLMLKEWVRQRLFSSFITSPTFTPGFTDEKKKLCGLLVRASSECHSPFLLKDQSMHKGLFLVTMDTEEYTVAVSLNHPTSRVVDLPITVKDTDFTMDVPFIQRYGGQYTIYGEGEMPVLWLHCNENLRKANIGTPLCSSGEGIWECTASQVAYAIQNYLAPPTGFMAISGGCVWEKTKGGKSGGILGEMQDGKYKPVPETLTDEVFSTLIQQDLMSTTNIDKNIGISTQAWDIAGGENIDKSDKTTVPMVLGSSVTVSTLSNVALRKWIATYILNAPGLQDELSEGYCT